MEMNVYYQLAQAECVINRCKGRLFRKNLTIIGLMGVTYILGKAFVAECKKAVDVRKERDELAEKHDKVLYELNQMKQAKAEKSVYCDGHAKSSKI